MLGVVANHLKDVSVLRRLLFASIQLPEELPNRWGIAVEFATDGKVKRNSIDTSTAAALVENILSFDKRAFDTDDSLMLELIGWVPSTDQRKPLGVVLISPELCCAICRQELTLRKDRPASVVVYDENLGTVPGSHFHKICHNKRCGVTQYYGYYTIGHESSQVFYNAEWRDLRYFVSSSLTVFSMQMLKRIDSQVLIGQLSYKQIAEIFNHVHECYHNPTKDMAIVLERYRLDRRRVEAAHFQFAVLQVASWYPHQLELTKLRLHGDIDATLSSVVASYHGLFMAQYSKHRCSKSGCGTVLVLDGNMKNHREVCAAQEAGYAEFDGLPGKVKTGCPNTPQLKSRYCPSHTPTAFTPHSEDQPTSASSQPKPIEEHQIAYIVGKKTTRKSTFYQVVRIGGTSAESTWEVASCLPADLIAEYEGGVLRELVDDAFSSGGKTVHSLSSRPSVASATQTAKRPRLDLSSTSTENFAVTAVESSVVKCNTLKDRVKLNYCTAGILAGIWPCGVITMLSELFRAESMTQVYASIHTFLHTNEDNLSDLNTICYDDGCHLKKFADKRASLTNTAGKIASCAIAIDKMHFKGHVDEWCKQNCNPYKLEQLNKVDTEVCEQTFSWLSRYARITRHMNRQHFMFYIIYICDLHNRMNC